MRLEELPEQEGPDTLQGAETSPAALLRSALESLSGEFEDKTYRMFWATAAEGRPAVEVAAEHGVSVHAVHQAKSRVSRRLRAALGGDEPTLA
jgi:RNA polymerase sigma-70 factor (ECF subfamily)